VIEATPADIDIDVPPPVSVDEARRASERYGGFTSHPFPSCLVCGPERADGDGFRVFPGPVDGRAMLAATWTPTTDLAEDGIVRTEFVWAALDCPGGWAMDQSDERPHVLGTIAATLVGDVVPGETYVAIGWGRGTEGRKSFVGSALFTARGERVGHAAATWVALKDPRVFTG
jgi:hypothetical protein